LTESADIRIAPVELTGRPASDGSDASGLLDAIAAAAKAGADLVLLPQLSFSLYFPALRDRGALELGERFPSPRMSAARQAATGAWLAASAYECVGEGVFYVTGELGSTSEGTVLTQRQHHIEAEAGRFEQMFISPGHEERSVARLPWGRTAMLVGADARCPAAWAELGRAGAGLVLVSVSETADGWHGIRRVAAGFSTIHGIAVCAVNRAPAPDEPDFAGGAFACDATGNEVTVDQSGLFHLSIPNLGASKDE
jgi:N-carbamoylputrescine amidase